jgi:hypothetical protein
MGDPIFIWVTWITYCEYCLCRKLYIHVLVYENYDWCIANNSVKVVIANTMYFMYLQFKVD